MAKKKYDNASMYFEDWTTKKLKKEAAGAHYAINIVECYGMSDLYILTGCLAELEKRGIVEDDQPLRFKKRED